MMNQTKPKIYANYDKMIMMNQTKPKLYLNFDIMIMMNRTRGKHNYTNTSVRANRDLGKIIFQKNENLFVFVSNNVTARRELSPMPATLP